MLVIEVPGVEMYDEENEVFIDTKPVSLRLEHSLVSISKWEAKWKKPFLSREQKTVEESRDYVRCMTLNQNVDPDVYLAIDPSMMQTINRYVEENQTATTIREDKNKPPSREIVTSELVYYWLTAYQIPWEAQKWHFSRLMMLIRIAQLKNEPEKKMPKSAVIARNKALNAARRKKLNTKG